MAFNVMEATMNRLLHNLTLLLVTIGAINWGLVGLFDINLVTSLLGSWPLAVKAVYALVGLSGIIFAAIEAKEHNYI